MLLAIDTSTHTCSFALYDERGVVGEITWHTHENHTRSLLPEIVRLMELVGTSTDRLRAIAVATGPGSFTGLRIGLSAAKGMAFSLNAALIGVPTLDISASAGVNQKMPVCAILQVGRGRFGAAIYENQNGAMQRASKDIFGTAEELPNGLREPVEKFDSILLIGETDKVVRDAFRAAFADRVVFANEALNIRRAGFLAALAWRRWRAGDVDDLQTLAPIYIPTASLA